MYGVAVGELCISLRLLSDDSCGPMIAALQLYDSCAIFVRHCRMLLLHSQLLLTTTMVGVCIERTLATLRADYEQKEAWQLGMLIVILTVRISRDHQSFRGLPPIRKDGRYLPKKGTRG